jgi:hypothetical protein
MADEPVILKFGPHIFQSGGHHLIAVVGVVPLAHEDLLPGGIDVEAGVPTHGLASTPAQTVASWLMARWYGGNVSAQFVETGKGADAAAK